MEIRRATALAALLLGLAGPALAQRASRPTPESRAADPRHQAPRADSPTPSSSTWAGGTSRSPFRLSPLVGGGLTTPRPGVDVFRAQPQTYRPLSPPWPGTKGDAPNRGRTREWSSARRRDGTGAVVYPLVGGIYVPPYSYWPYGATTATAPQAEQTTPEAPTGFLRLLVTPRNAAVIVDGIYEGLVDDFGGTGERALPSGVHHVRLETEGFEPVEFDVRIPDNDTITLRRDLSPRSAAPAVQVPAPAPAPPSPRKTIYVIPRCYLGDTPPRADQLPAGCNVADLRTLP